MNHRIRKVTASTGIITTIAGIGTAGSGGDGSAATNAQLLNPSEVSVDSVGNIFIADYTNNRIRKVTASTGVITTIAGTGAAGSGGDGSAATNARLLNPTGVSVDSVGNVVIADTHNNRIRKINVSTGVITTIAGTGTEGSGGDGSAATIAQLHVPTKLAVDSVGNIFIADYANNRIRKINASTGDITTIAGNGTAGSGGDGSAATNAQLLNPTGVSVDSVGNIFIADTHNHRIRKINASTGVITAIAGTGTAGSGGDGSAATFAMLNNPTAVSVDSVGNVFIADYTNNRIRKISSGNDALTHSESNSLLAQY